MPARVRLALLVALAAMLLVAWAAVLVRGAYEWSPNSDNASVVLTGQALAHGNWNLHGWWLGTAPFWTSESLLFAVAVASAGVSLGVAQAVAGLVWWGIAVLSLLLAGSGFDARNRGIAILTTLGFVAMVGTGLLVSGIHNFTTLLGLAAIASATVALRRPRWRVPATAGTALLLAAGIDGDILTLAIAAAPIVGASALWALRTGSLRPWSWPLSAVVVAGAAAFVLRWVAASAGGYTHPSRIAGVPATWPVVRDTLGALAGFLRLRPPGSALDSLDLLAVLVLVGLALVGLISWLRRWTVVGIADVDGWLTAVLLGGAATNVAAFLLFAVEPMPPGSCSATSTSICRRLVPACVYLAIAIARLALMGDPVRRVLSIACAAAAGVNLVPALSAAADVLSRPVAQPPEIALAVWLERQGLTEGYGGYWDANVVTVAGGERVRVYPLRPTADGRLAPYQWNADAGWYDPAKRHPVFVVLDPANVVSVDRESAEHTFGPPASEARVDRYTVLVWDRNLAPLIAREG